MHSRLATVDDLGRYQERQVLEPEMSFLAFAMTEHPRLDDLVRFADLAGDNGLRVFECLERDRRSKQLTHKIQGALLATISDLLGKPAGT
ncbi:hypothetical protein [Stutzerimonas nitrititolerans]|uniref:hypothetical protein n=1 Tax=Stutzerimonas nitrititolerans TaxID=2482751 RepID=UPI003AA918D7